LKNLKYFDIDSHDVKSGQHARYDEGMNDVTDTPPNARLVRFAQRRELSPQKPYFLEPLDLDVAENPFQDLRTLSVLVDGDDLYLGFVFSKCSHRLRAYLSELQLRAYATAFASSPVHTSCRSRVVLFSLSSKPTLLSPLLSTLVQLMIASNSLSQPSLAPILSTFVSISASSAASTQADPRSSYRFGEGGSTFVSATVAALEDVH
jgi:hypothetical protein